MLTAKQTDSFSYVLPVEGVVVRGEALNHEVLDNDEVIQNIFPGYFQKTNQPHFISLPRHCLGALNAGADCTLQHLSNRQFKGFRKSSLV